jgi:hypothetical protein
VFASTRTSTFQRVLDSSRFQQVVGKVRKWLLVSVATAFFFGVTAHVKIILRMMLRSGCGKRIPPFPVCTGIDVRKVAAVWRMLQSRDLIVKRR